MTNPTSYTDEQVLELIELCSKGPTQAGVRHMGVSAALRSLRADRLRLQAEVEALRDDADRYRWLRVHCVFANDSMNELWFDRQLERGEADALDRQIDAARATPNETKEAKS